MDIPRKEDNEIYIIQYIIPSKKYKRVILKKKTRREVKDILSILEYHDEIQIESIGVEKCD